MKIMSRPAASAAVSVERFFQLSLLGLVASGYLAVAGSGYLDTPTIVLTAAGLTLRGLLVLGLLRLEISERTTTVLTLAYTAFFGVDYLLLSRDFLQATVHLVFFLAVMKILTARTPRDFLHTAVIAFLELLAAAILSVNLNFFLFLALYLLFAMAALTSAEIRRSVYKSPATARSGTRRFHFRLAALTGFITLAILSVTACLFFVLPRTADAAFSRLISRRVFLPGFSNQVTLGEIGEVKNMSRPVMHIRIYARDVPGGLKWRGGALSEFDGKRWSNPSDDRTLIPLKDGQAQLQEPFERPGFNYHVELSNIDTDALFFTGSPVRIQMRHPILYRTSTDSFRLGHVPTQGVRYDAYSQTEIPPEAMVVSGGHSPVLPLEARERFLQLPRIDPRIPELARSMSTPLVSDLSRARAIEQHLRQDYGYTLELLKQEVPDPLAYFLFTRKKGHCEYFASAMTVMLRSLGIPSRMVNGFQSGLWNPITEQWVIRSSDAHSWVEAWIPGRGWATFDPTPPDPGHALSLWAKLALYTDAADTFWQEWVVSYDLNRQGTLADKMEQGARRLGVSWFTGWGGLQVEWKSRVTGFLNVYGVRLLVVAGLALWFWLLGPPLLRLLRVRQRVRRVRRGQASVADATLLYERMLHLLKRRGYQKPAWFTPREFAQSLPNPHLGTLVAEFTTAYNAVRFGGQTEIAPRLSILLEELEHQES
jgi:transglutaminase-like putative cysteine protease